MASSSLVAPGCSVFSPGCPGPSTRVLVNKERASPLHPASKVWLNLPPYLGEEHTHTPNSKRIRPRHRLDPSLEGVTDIKPPLPWSLCSGKREWYTVNISLLMPYLKPHHDAILQADPLPFGPRAGHAAHGYPYFFASSALF